MSEKRLKLLNFSEIQWITVSFFFPYETKLVVENNFHMPESTCHSLSSTYSQGTQSQPEHNDWLLINTCKYDFQKLQSHSYSIKLGKEHWRTTSLMSHEVPWPPSFIISNVLASLLPKSQYSESQDKLLKFWDTCAESFRAWKERWKWEWAQFPLPLLFNKSVLHECQAAPGIAL